MYGKPRSCELYGRAIYLSGKNEGKERYANKGDGQHFSVKVECAKCLKILLYMTWKLKASKQQCE